MTEEYYRQILSLIGKPPATLPVVKIDDSRSRNAGRCMALLACNRLSQSHEAPRLVRHTTFEWKDGIVSIRNSRIHDHHWSTAQEGVVRQLHEFAQERPVVYLLLHWNVDNSSLDAWAVPEHVAFNAFSRLPAHARGDSKTVEVSTDDHQLKHAPGAPSFAPYYIRSELTEAERAKLLEAIKTDDAIKQERLNEAEDEPNAAIQPMGADSADVSDDSEDELVPTYTDETVAFLQELAEHTEDASWHELNKRRYETLLRDPSRAVVEELRTRYIQRLSPAVAGGKRHLSILKKNDYGKGGYHDHYWFAFYDPAAGSKTKSVQLFVRFLGRERLWRYGLAMGNYCGQYLEQLLAAIMTNRKAIADYLQHSPADTTVRMYAGEEREDLSPSAFAKRVTSGADDTLRADGPLTNISIIREYDLSTLPTHSDSLVDEIGEYFTWAWPFFEAAMTGEWRTPGSTTPPATTDEEEIGDVDETAPMTIGELSSLTALTESFLSDVEDSLWAKRQVILVGPPGTSKTFIARQFARYFVRQRQGQPQGSFDVLYMHANWNYEDFFEGLKPTSKDGALSFEPRLGFFLQWVAGLKDYSPRARHVLVLDEINRCDTAAVLGELLQLLEYRDVTVPLLSGRRFVFPSNVFIIGTMNSADRSIGRLDLALQRRFMWLNLHPQPDTLERWLGRPGNNPLGFQASALKRCNELLAEHGIPPEQHIGHALFMQQRAAEDDEVSPRLDKPLSEKHLRQIVRFSVLPYVRELLTMQFGQADAGLLEQLSNILLSCIDKREATSTPESIDDQSPT